MADPTIVGVSAIASGTGSTISIGAISGLADVDSVVLIVGTIKISLQSMTWPGAFVSKCHLFTDIATYDTTLDIAVLHNVTAADWSGGFSVGITNSTYRAIAVGLRSGDGAALVDDVESEGQNTTATLTCGITGVTVGGPSAVLAVATMTNDADASVINVTANGFTQQMNGTLGGDGAIYAGTKIVSSGASSAPGLTASSDPQEWNWWVHSFRNSATDPESTLIGGKLVGGGILQRRLVG